MVGIGAALDVPAHNAAYGERVPTSGRRSRTSWPENLTLAAEEAKVNEATVLLEPLSGPKPYPLRTAKDVVAVLDRLEVDNVGLLFDLYHLAATAMTSTPRSTRTRNGSRTCRCGPPWSR